MPSRNAHIYQAEKNDRFVDGILAGDSGFLDFAEWAVVALFYSALHYADAYFDQQLNFHPMSHRQRNTLINQSSELYAISSNYRYLYERSRDARYNLIPFPSSQVVNLKNQEFEPLKQLFRSLLSLT